MKYKVFGIAMTAVMLVCALSATALEAEEGPYRVHQHMEANLPEETCTCGGTELCTHLPIIRSDPLQPEAAEPWSSAASVSLCPVGVPVRRGTVDRGALNAWWAGRAIPATRDGIGAALEVFGLPSPQLLPERCLGLRLSDQYWLRPPGQAARWGDVNFFQHSFPGDVGDVLLGKVPSGQPIRFLSPDNTTDGWLKKRWILHQGRRCLLKAGSGPAQQEPYNEALASLLMARLGIPHVSYTLTLQGDQPYSLCEDFLSPDTELVPAWSILQTRRKPNHTSVFQHYLDCCHALGIPGIREAVEQMIVVDYLLANEDRHQNNFGVIRRGDTLEYLGAAPLYDSGTCLWFDRPTPLVGGGKVVCKPFKNRHEDRLRLVTSLAWLDLSLLDGIEGAWMDLTCGAPTLDEERAAAVARGLRRRIAYVKHLSPVWSPGISSTQGDVAEDLRYSG